MTRTSPPELDLQNLTSNNPAMQRCLLLARRAAQVDLPILLLGETGTGKTLLAHAIHNSSPRCDATFVSFNASAMTDTLLESQLFGHEKGAFTGATSAMRGKFEIAHGGTLFFDEIADMSALAQAKILRAVEYGEYERLGSEKMRHADVRIISATNQPLRELTATRRFRDDLYHRLNGLTLRLPALRDRSEDLAEMIAAELKSCAQAMDRQITSIHPEAFDMLLEYPWPGNLRELHRVIQAVVLFTEGEVVLPDVIRAAAEPLEEVHRGETVRVAPAAAEPPPVQDAPPPPADIDYTLATAVRKHVWRVYEMTGRTKVATAKLLDISRATLDRKLKNMES